MSAEPGLPQVGELVRFTTKANGDVVGSYFNGLFYSVTSNDCWSPQYVTSWCRVLVLPDSDELRATLVLRLHREGWRPPCDGWSPEDTTANGEAAWAALREAAIR